MFVAKAIKGFSNLHWLPLILHLFDELCQQENGTLLETENIQFSTMPDWKGLKRLWLILLEVLAPLQLYAKSSTSLMMSLRQMLQTMKMLVLTRLLPMVESVLSFRFLGKI